MSTLNLDINYFGHPKIVRLSVLLGKGAAEYPIRLWCYCAQEKERSQTGLLPANIEEVEKIAGWKGAAGKMVEALLESRLLEKTLEGYEIHDWKDHAKHLMTFQGRGKIAALKKWTAEGVPENAFELIWRDYPNKDGKKLALRHFQASIKRGQDWADIQKALKNYLASPRVKDGFVKNGSTWFGNWSDWTHFNGLSKHVNAPPAPKKYVEKPVNEADLPKPEELKDLLADFRRPVQRKRATF